MIRTIAINEYFLLPGGVPLADVRTPAEFAHGHIPGAFNLPLFTNEERVLVGTTYKQVGREEAILLGFDLTGSKWSGFIKHALEVAPGKKVAVHCWRGGMRSGAMAWALSLYGFEVFLIEGGYKSFRRWALEQFQKPAAFLILGGRTGSGKTKILRELASLGEQVIDLEDLAQHQGSSYGTMNRLVQPTQEQFENNLACQLKDINREKCLWVEDESRNIGKLTIPAPFFNQMSSATLIDIKVGLDQRVEALTLEYGPLEKEFLIACTNRIHKRLGPLQTKQAIAAISEGNMEEFIRIVLVYYDKTYQKDMAKRSAEKVLTMDITSKDMTVNAKQILNYINTIPATAHP
ncbi:tRNA 2-selenouridine(34) synthase MnmH [Dyadobacter chenwenxiniae]|uniref:tRNA 2-selenouridine(34) synthase MnmH n=1 Tax=Dyadobacter chenwenxiniae TaxID=2906456 RepID=A0A9X1PMW3_9BACT|nr:tRNA 2-selenouridine(34) synthase MnmH [Dyadobacter chenwenxiniae]MCF0063380.1 tRNA 2-selenouridine(34) synthase MnmH [Dyadobacter chenwenxiniae]UON85241.1 tRNA 2-selenouridine(34) synthase MnmH [Dyadobacter chenwenxiniae]